jgi:uncharacterized protein (DUF1810 family)
MERFLKAQERDYATALTEIKAGRKRSHWIWYIFPQLAGLGYSEMSKRYALKNLAEATTYLQHPVLGKRLINISQAILTLNTHDPTEVMGYPDDLKLRSSMTLFSLVPGADPVFAAVLQQFFNGQKDQATLRLILP